VEGLEWNDEEAHNSIGQPPKPQEEPMLVLTRKRGENIVIDGEIVVQVLEIKGSRVVLGIQAPNHVDIVRQELLLDPEEAKKEELLSV